jgi:hypothetical protein
MGRADKQAWHFQESAKVALLSAQANAPSLMPHLIYLQGPADSFTTWMHSHGARVHVRTLPFFDELTAAQLERDKGLLNWGAYGRLEIPSLIVELGLAAKHTHVLYTDADVMFARDVRPAELPRPRVLAAAREGEMAKWGFNSGVMVLDVRAMHASYAQLLAHGRSKRWRFFLFDQTLLNEFYEKDFEWLDDRLNARVSLLPYCTGRAHLTHPETKQTAPGESNSSCPHARIWHWHGIKPWDVDCWFRRIEQLRPPPPDPYSAGMSAGRPLQGLEMRHALVRTGCRWTAQRTPPCYLVAFAHLLAAFKAFAAAAAE